MTKKVPVREHLIHTTRFENHPDGLTIWHAHSRNIHSSITLEQVIETVQKTDTKKLRHPTKNKLNEFEHADDFDDLIALRCDYFNEKFPPDSPNALLDPDVIKALIASESSFKPDAKARGGSLGLAQITKETLKIIQDAEGEAKEVIFSGIRQKYLTDLRVAIAEPQPSPPSGTLTSLIHRLFGRIFLGIRKGKVS